MGKLDNRVALVTGAASGIGKAISRKFSGEGAYIAVVDIARDAAEELAEEIIASGSKAIAIECDVTDERQVDQAVKQTFNRIGWIAYSG